MSDKKERGEELAPKKAKSTRIRKNVCGNRVRLSLRLDPELRQQLMILCDSLHISANSYVTGLIEIDLQSRKK